MSGNTSGKNNLTSIDKNKGPPRMKKLRGRIVRPAMSTAEIKASDERRKAEEELQRRKAEVQERTSNFLQDCIDEKRAEDKKLAIATANAEGNNTVPEDGNPVPEDQQSAPTYPRSHLQVDEKDWCEKHEAKGKEVPEPEHPITPCSPEDYDLFDGDEKAREEFCKYAAKQMFDGRMGW